ncbi:hypothetical protein [Halobiforma nitratireducens]|uniref:Uncharacterized protein n=1 Tax=Halobiforma nitratireducens JCM 10879 TaxID=1227454 RepID=M0LYS6_9EURY|nr:hypothetical protein [Halobiforma nitratireducens]EMA38328.1 hypothetical protein C446_10065 [Halobiforma nitratireducens JCM 10879]
MTSSDDGGYVHDPSAFDEDGTHHDDDRGGDEELSDDPPHPAATNREFGRRGWILVGVMLFAFVIAPVAILLFPPSSDHYRFALLILPLAPAIALAATAVWATTRP